LLRVPVVENQTLSPDLQDRACDSMNGRQMRMVVSERRHTRPSVSEER
jgi:hypothetical protein